MRKALCLGVLFISLSYAPHSLAQDENLIQAARKEGKVVWYTSLDLPTSSKLAQIFKTQYVGIDVEVHRAGSQRVLTRFMQEVSAGIKNADVIHTSDGGHFVLLKNKGLLMRYTPGGVDRFPASFKDNDGFHYSMRATLSTIAYNSRLVPDRDAPKTWKGLLDPKWTGKIVTAHPGYSGIIMTHVLALLHLYDWDYFKELAKNKLHLVQSADDPATVVASGERPIAANGTEYIFYKSFKEGNPVRIVYPKEGIPLVISPTAIAKDAPHPNAAKLFTDFLFTQEMQQLLADSMGIYTGHPQVTYPKDKPQLRDMKLLIVDPLDLEKRNAEIKKRFAEIFGA